MRRKKLLRIASLAVAVTLLPITDTFAYDFRRDYRGSYSDYDVNYITYKDYSNKYNCLDSVLKFSNGSINQSEYTSGEIVEFSVDVDDTLIKQAAADLKKGKEVPQYLRDCMLDQYKKGVNKITIHVAPEKSDTFEEIILTKSKDNADGTSHFTGKLEIGPFMTAGKWKIREVYINKSDSYPNHYALVNYWNKDIYGNDTLQDLSWGDFLVKGTQSDTSAPKIYDIKVEKLSTGERRVTWKIKDKNLKKCYVKKCFGSHTLKTVKVKAKNNQYKYILPKDFDIENDSIDVYAVDQAGNRTWFYYENGKITSDQTKKYAKVEAKASDITVSQKKVNKGNSVEVRVKVDVKKYSKMKKLYLCYDSPYGATKVYVKLKQDKNSVWKGTFNTKNEMPRGKWTLAAISFDEKFIIENSKYCKDTEKYNYDGKFRQDLSAGNITVK